MVGDFNVDILTKSWDSAFFLDLLLCHNLLPTVRGITRFLMLGQNILKPAFLILFFFWHNSHMFIWPLGHSCLIECQHKPKTTLIRPFYLYFQSKQQKQISLISSKSESKQCVSRKISWINVFQIFRHQRQLFQSLFRYHKENCSNF